MCMNLLCVRLALHKVRFARRWNRLKLQMFVLSPHLQVELPDFMLSMLRDRILENLSRFLGSKAS